MIVDVEPDGTPVQTCAAGHPGFGCGADLAQAVMKGNEVNSKVRQIMTDNLNGLLFPICSPLSFHNLQLRSNFKARDKAALVDDLQSII